MHREQKKHFTAAKRVVIKVGSGVLTADTGLNMRALNSISRQICRIMDQGLEVVLVSSGAMAAGLRKIGLDKRPSQIPQRQAVAAVGQAGLMMAYEKAFGRYGKKVAQLLLTQTDMSDRKRYLNARNTIYTLLSWKIVPIVNENDTVATEELKFGDNDNLSALIALLMDADLLINLTDIEGVFDKDPRVQADAQLIPEIGAISRSLEKAVEGIPGALGTGGMLSKVKAAKKVTTAGVPMVIVRGEKKDILLRLFQGESHGTFFVPKREKWSRRKCWIAFTMKPQGTLVIDDGAAHALLRGGKSLLPIGVTAVEGDFGIGACVALQTLSDQQLGRGLVNYSAADIRRIAGVKTTQIQERLGSKPYDEVIHRDNLTLTEKTAGVGESF